MSYAHFRTLGPNERLGHLYGGRNACLGEERVHGQGLDDDPTAVRGLARVGVSPPANRSSKRTPAAISNAVTEWGTASDESRLTRPGGTIGRHNDYMGAIERCLRDRVADTLAEIEHLDVRPMFSGFGFYVDGLLVAAAWDRAFRLRHRTGGHWIYQPVDEALLDDPDLLVPLVRDRFAALSELPEARPRRSKRNGSRSR